MNRLFSQFIVQPLIAFASGAAMLGQPVPVPRGIDGLVNRMARIPGSAQSRAVDAGPAQPSQHASPAGCQAVV